MMILFWALIGFAIYYLITNSSVGENKNKKKEDSNETLKMRFVNGEIDEDTYRRTLKVLND